MPRTQLSCSGSSRCEGRSRALGAEQAAAMACAASPACCCCTCRRPWPRATLRLRQACGKLAVLRDLSLTALEIRQSIWKCPQLFLYNDYAATKMQGKLRFMRGVLGRPVRPVLANQPHLLMRSLAGMECKVGERCKQLASSM
jgi:hypothetical protein